MEGCFFKKILGSNHYYWLVLRLVKGAPESKNLASPLIIILSEHLELRHEQGTKKDKTLYIVAFLGLLHPKRSLHICQWNLLSKGFFNLHPYSE